MHCLDTNALIDYLEGEEDIGAFLTSHQEPFFASTVSLYEVFVGAARLREVDGVEDVHDDLDWVQPLPLTVTGAGEAALIDAELQDAGTPIGAMDTLIAGIVREAGATLVTADGDFEQVADITVVNYRDMDDGGVN
jgi:predicted nucleic acid-binding protein